MSLNYKYEQTKYGLYISFKGRICAHDLEFWFNKLFKEIEDVKFKKSFGMIIKFDDIEPICVEAARMLAAGRAFLIGKGLHRTAIVFDSSAKIVDLMRAFNIIGQYKLQRMICTMANKDADQKAIDWVENGIEP